MANVTFHVGTTTPGSSGLTADGLYVDKTNGQIFYATSTTAKKQIGSSLKMMNDKGWVLLNGTSGTLISSISSSVWSTITTYARDIFFVIKDVPKSMLYPNSCDETSTVSKYLYATQPARSEASFITTGMPAWFDLTAKTANTSTTVYYMSMLKAVTIESSKNVVVDCEYLWYNGSSLQLDHNSHQLNTSYVKIIGYRF